MPTNGNSSINKDGILDPKKCPDNPMELFSEWYADAVNAKIDMPETMVLSTVSTDNRASSRVVLLKDYDDGGFVFFSNYISRKGRHLSANPYCSLVIHWAGLDRQVRVEGKAERVNKSVSDNYFASRPRLSQLGAWASKQSATISSRMLLVRNLEYATEQYEGKEVAATAFLGRLLSAARAGGILARAARALARALVLPLRNASIVGFAPKSAQVTYNRKSSGALPAQRNYRQMGLNSGPACYARYAITFARVIWSLAVAFKRRKN